MASVRETLLAAITAAVGDTAHVIPFQDAMDVPDRITVMFKQISITPLPSAPRAAYVVNYILTVVSPALDPALAEAELDIFVPSLLAELDGLDWFAWSIADKVLSQSGNLAYDITCWNIGYRVPDVTPPPVGEWSPASIPGLSSWHDAADASTFTFSSGTNVAEWRDKSGLGHHLTQPNTGYQPRRSATQNGHGAVVFNISHMDTAPYVVPQPFTVILAMHARDNTPAAYWAANGVDVQMASTEGGGMTLRSNGRVVGANRLQAGDHIWAGTYNGDSSTVRVDGVQTGEGSLGTWGTTSGWRTGEPNLHPMVPNMGTFFEVIIYSRVLLLEELQAVEDYLQEKWQTARTKPNPTKREAAHA